MDYISGKRAACLFKGATRELRVVLLLHLADMMCLARDLHLICTLYNGIIVVFFIKEINHDVYKSDN